MLIQIDPASEIPIYTQLTNQIIEGIAREELKSGDSLPSVRSFAADLGVNMHTVNKSYHELEKKGIIKIVPKSGAIINSFTHLDSSTEKRIHDAVRPLVAEALVKGWKEEDIQQLIHQIINDLRRDNE